MFRDHVWLNALVADQLIWIAESTPVIPRLTGGTARDPYRRADNPAHNGSRCGASSAPEV